MSDIDRPTLYLALATVFGSSGMALNGDTETAAIFLMVAALAFAAIGLVYSIGELWQLIVEDTGDSE